MAEPSPASECVSAVSPLPAAECVADGSPLPAAGAVTGAGWQEITSDERRSRCRAAIEGADRPALLALLEAFLLLFSRRGSQTSPNTLRTYRLAAGQVMDWAAAAGVRLDGLTADHAPRFVNHLRDLGRAPSTIRNRIAAASALARALAWCGATAANPWAGVTVYDPTPPWERAERYNEAEVEALVDVAGKRDLAIVLLGADGGLRVSETVRLAWSEVDASGRRLRVVSGKGGKTRTVAMTDRLVEALAAWRLRQAAEEEGGAEPERVLGQTTTSTVRRWLKALCLDAGVTPRGSHALRHRCGTALYAICGDLARVAHHLGHGSLDTSRIYARMADDAYVAAVVQLGGRRRRRPRRPAARAGSAVEAR